MTVKLFAFTCGWMTLRASFFLDGAEGKIRAPVPAYLIEHPDGRALFDTGLGRRFQTAPGAPPRKDRVEFDDTADIAARLRGVGVEPESIRWIVNSHLHTDHCGGNVFIPNATIVLQAAEWDFARSAEDGGYQSAEFDTGHPVLKVHGEHDLYGDGSVVLFPSPGHTPGHQCARVRLSCGDVILAADCCNLRASLDRLWLPDHVHDADAARNTLLHLRDLRTAGAQIFYGHDPEFWSGIAKGEALP